MNNRVDNHTNAVILQTILKGMRELGGKCVVDVFGDYREQAEILERPVRGARAVVAFNPLGKMVIFSPCLPHMKPGS